MKKRILSILLVATMVLGLAACGSKPAETKSAETTESAEGGETAAPAEATGEKEL